jgi:hypothetical protein
VAGSLPAELEIAISWILPMVGKDSRRKPARGDRFTSASGGRHWRSEAITTCDAMRRAACAVERGVLMELHRDVLTRLSALVPRAVTVVADESAGRLTAWGDRDFDDIVDEWGAQSFPASDPPSNW